MAKKTTRTVMATLFGLMALGFAWLADYIAGDPANSGNDAIFTLILGCSSIACLVIAILFVCKPPPCMKNSSGE